LFLCRPFDDTFRGSINIYIKDNFLSINVVLTFLSFSFYLRIKDIEAGAKELTLHITFWDPNSWEVDTCMSTNPFTGTSKG